MRRAEYSEGSGLLVVEENRLLFLSSTNYAAALNLEVAALLGQEPIRSLAVALANEDSGVPPFVFLEAADALQGVVCGNIQLACEGSDHSVVDGAVEDFWAYFSAEPSAAVSCGDDVGPLWLDTGAVRASAFRWLPAKGARPPLVLAHQAKPGDEGTTSQVQALVCFECQGPNPPMTARCRTCTAFLTEDNSDIQEVAQPSLGAIHLSDGRIEPLDADLIIGRNPERFELEPHQRAVVHGTGDQSISRRHIELHREGWNVLVSCLKQPTESTVQGRLGGRIALEFGVPHQLSDGDLVNYGSAWFRYEQNHPAKQ